MLFDDLASFKRTVRSVVNDAENPGRPGRTRISDAILRQAAEAALYYCLGQSPEMHTVKLDSDDIETTDGLLTFSLQGETTPMPEDAASVKPGLMRLLDARDGKGRRFRFRERKDGDPFLADQIRLLSYEQEGAAEVKWTFMIGDRPREWLRVTYAYRSALPVSGEEGATLDTFDATQFRVLPHLETPLIYLTGSFMLFSDAVSAANLAQYKSRAQSGSPSDNPVLDVAERFRLMALDMLKLQQQTVRFAA